MSARNGDGSTRVQASDWHARRCALRVPGAFGTVGHWSGRMCAGVFAVATGH
jgi:hypothetical protein